MRTLTIDTPCQEWEGSQDGYGYGMLKWDGKTVRAHRLAFKLHYGYWPEVARHKCDNPPCFNPEHLEDGTRADNNRDRDERGRHRTHKGESHGMAKILDADVAIIKESWRRQLATRQELADFYGVSYQQIWRITKGLAR